MKNTILAIIFTTLMIGQNEYMEQILIPDNVPGLSMIGTIIAMNQDYIFATGTSSKVYIFQRQGTEWIESQVIQGPTDQLFGLTMCLNDNFAFIGAPGDPLDGHIYVYELENELWVEHSTLYDNENSWFFGQYIDCTEERFIVRSNFHTIDVYDYNGFEWINQSTISNEQSTGFGYALHLYNNLVFSGTLAGGPDARSVFSFELIDNEWIQTDVISIENIEQDNAFGSDIIYDNNQLFISAPGNDGGVETVSGLVYVFEYNGSSWQEIDVISSSNPMIGDRFGKSIDIAGDYIAIGSPEYNYAGYKTGALYIFQRNEDSFIEHKIVYPTDIISGDLFGISVKIEENYVIAGAPIKNNLTGAVYVFDPNDNSLHANFAGMTLSGQAPANVEFHDLSQGNPTSWQWDFNDDGVIDSTEPNPSYTYLFQGNYTVSLTVFDAESESSFSKESYIYVSSDLIIGDVDLSGNLDVLDIVLIVGFILGESELTEIQTQAGDLNGSGIIDVIDIVLLVDLILN
jgi:PKD repeat protein